MSALSFPRVWRGVLAVFLGVLALVGFWPSPVDRPVQTQIVGFLAFIHTHGVPAWVGYQFIEASANVVLFVPLGILAALAFPSKRWWQIGAFGLLISGFMELGQLLFLQYRFPSPLDLATNTAGCVLGAFVAALFVRPRSRSSRVVS